MGYCYTAGGGLVCDGCGATGGVRKRACPYNWCAPPALCEACNEKDTRDHSGCKIRHAQKLERDAQHQRLLDQGAYLRVSALGVGQGEDYKVQVIFRNSTGHCQGFYMSKDTYAALPLLAAATPDDFRPHGALTEAPVSFY